MICNTVYHLNWGCPKKRQARFETIISQYRKHINNALPVDKQYWTMCGLCCKNNQLIDGCELSQMLNVGLITPEQFHGVDIDEPTIQSNRQLTLPCKWYNADFYDTLVNAYNNNQFNPAIINFDILLMPKKGCIQFANILNLLNNVKNCLVIGNFIIKHSYRNQIVESKFIIDMLSSLPRFKNAYLKGKWNTDWATYCYNGSGKSTNTWMGSVVFYKTL